MKVISGILILITAGLSFSHGWSGLRMKPGSANLLTTLGVSPTLVFIISALTLSAGILIFFPRSFLIANLFNAATILLVMILSVKSGNYRTALIEIPFLLLPLVLIWLGHPLAK